MINAEDYDDLMVNKYRMSLEAIRKHANEFAYWQRRRGTGRLPVPERDLLIAFQVRQLFDTTFRETEGGIDLIWVFSINLFNIVLNMNEDHL